MVYFIVQNWEYVKIGVSDAPESRLSSFQTGNPIDLYLWVALPGGAKLEAKMHKYFEKLCIGREWFKFKPEIEYCVEYWVEKGVVTFDIEFPWVKKRQANLVYITGEDSDEEDKDEEDEHQEVSS